jgi:aspartyl-tRNA(Asn)/glutamyl-tRNA(Gln) amidotransferase subunit B
MRSKEDSQDYRYFPDPDLPPLRISREWVEQVRATMPELPTAMRERFIAQYGISDYDAMIVTQSKATAAYFEAAINAGSAGDKATQAKQVANWVMGDVSSTLNREGIEISQIPVTAAQLALLLQRITDGTISNKIAKEVFAAMWQAPSADDNLADQVIDSKGLKQISDVGALEKIIDEVMAANQQSVDAYRAGNEKAFNALVGQAMKATKGKGNPAQVNELLKKILMQ